jgi:hypothetical protein
MVGGEDHVEDLASADVGDLERERGMLPEIFLQAPAHQISELSGRILGQFPLLIATTVTGVDLQLSTNSGVETRVIEAFT